MSYLFKSSKYLENQIDELLDAISQGITVFKDGIADYFKKDMESFYERIEMINKLEEKADGLRRTIENDLYEHSLIPEHRGDVLGLLESIDAVIDISKETLYQFYVEKPFFPESLNEDYIKLADASVMAGESLVMATRAFFKDISSVKNYLHKVYYYEKEADKVGLKLKQNVFENKELKLAQKMHLRYFALHIDNLADISEDVADRLSIYSIKRKM